MTSIEQLKKNEKPLGLMSDELRRELVRIKFRGHLQVFSLACEWETHDQNTAMNTDTTYRLRSDYDEKPEIVECVIRERDGELVYVKNGNRLYVDMAFRDPDHAGFKFESGQVELSLIVFKSDCSTKSICQFRDLVDLEVLHATHVLFRGQK